MCEKVCEKMGGEWSGRFVMAWSRERGGEIAVAIRESQTLTEAAAEEERRILRGQFSSPRSAKEWEGAKALADGFLKVRQRRLRGQAAAALDGALSVLEVWMDKCRTLAFGPAILAVICSLLVDIAVASSQPTSTSNLNSTSNSSLISPDIRAEDGGEEGGEGGEENEALQRVLNGLRQHVGRFRGEGDLPFLNAQIFITVCATSIQIFLLLRNLAMAAQFLRGMPAFDEKLPPGLTRGVATKYKYYYGLLLLQREQIHEANEAFTFAYSVCPRGTAGRQGQTKTESVFDEFVDMERKIVAALFTARLRLSLAPASVDLLTRHQLHPYLEILAAVAGGRVQAVEDVLAKWSETFYADGTYLALEKTVLIAQVVLIKKTHQWTVRNHYTAAEAASSAHILPLPLLTTVMRFSLDPAMDEEEVMCILANLIRHSLLRGYVAWTQKVLVLSKINPYP